MNLRKNKLSPTTYNGYLSALDYHIKPYFSTLGKSIRDIKAKDIEAFCNYKLQEGKSPKTIHKLLSLISHSFRYAEKNDYIIKNPIIKNPMNVIDKPAKVKSETSYYNADQLNTLAKVVKDTTIEVPVILAMILGLRRSEIVGITWDNIDFDNKLLHIKQSVVVCDSNILPKGSYKIIGYTKGKRKKEIILKFFLKTDSSMRSFAMNDMLCNYLKALKSKQNDMLRETLDYKDFLCVNEVGELLTPDSITKKT